MLRRRVEESVGRRVMLSAALSWQLVNVASATTDGGAELALALQDS
jgi:hypothetical protein